MLAAWRWLSIAKQRGKSGRKIGQSLAIVDPSNSARRPPSPLAHHALDRAASRHPLADDARSALRHRHAREKTRRPVKCKSGLRESGRRKPDLGAFATAMRFGTKAVTVEHIGRGGTGRQKGRNQSDDATSRDCHDASPIRWRHGTLK